MSVSLQDLIDKAKLSGDWNPVTDWCEAFRLANGVGVPAAEFYLKCVYEASPEGETQLVEAVSAARAGNALAPASPKSSTPPPKPPKSNSLPSYSPPNPPISNDNSARSAPATSPATLLLSFGL